MLVIRCHDQHRYYHDDQIFSEHYEQITAHINNLIQTATINNADGLLTYGGWGDWCPPSGCRACWTNKGPDGDSKIGAVGDGVTGAATSTLFYSIARVVAGLTPPRSRRVLCPDQCPS